MKIYFVFKGDGYYPIGGWDDYPETFKVLEEAVESAQNLGVVMWSHIAEFDLATFDCEIIKRFNSGIETVSEVSVDYQEIIREIGPPGDWDLVEDDE